MDLVSWKYVIEPNDICGARGLVSGFASSVANLLPTFKNLSSYVDSSDGLTFSKAVALWYVMFVCSTREFNLGDFRILSFEAADSDVYIHSKFFPFSLDQDDNPADNVIYISWSYIYNPHSVYVIRSTFQSLFVFLKTCTSANNLRSWSTSTDYLFLNSRACCWYTLWYADFVFWDHIFWRHVDAYCGCEPACCDVRGDGCCDSSKTNFNLISIDLLVTFCFFFFFLQRSKMKNVAVYYVRQFLYVEFCIQE